jgi:hypothetical protein
MALLKATRTAQTPLLAEFVFNYNDTMADIAGVTKTFGSVYTDLGTFDAINLPLGAVVEGGEVIVETQGAGPTAYTLSVGVNGATTAYATTVDLKGAAGTKTAFTLTTTSFSSLDGKNVRLTMNSTAANATAGKFRVRVLYTIDGRANEVVSS